MNLSDLFEYLHLKQTLISRATNFSSGKEKRKLQNALHHYLKLEDILNSLCESVYYSSLGENNHENKC